MSGSGSSPSRQPFTVMEKTKSDTGEGQVGNQKPSEECI